MGENRSIETRKVNTSGTRPCYSDFLGGKDKEVEIEHQVYEKIRDFEQEIFVNSLLNPDTRNSTEELSRRKKKPGLNDQSYIKRVPQEELEHDIAQIRQLTKNTNFHAQIENKVLKTKRDTFKKNDRVKISMRSNIENVVISWINSNEVTFRRHDGSKFKCNIADISSGALRIYKLRKT